jgi:hypothetical protein
METSKLKEAERHLEDAFRLFKNAPASIPVNLMVEFEGAIAKAIGILHIVDIGAER